MTPGAEKESRAAVLRHNTALIEAAQAPEEQQAQEFARLDAAREELPMLARQLALHTSLVTKRFLEVRAELRSAAAALAVERFRRRHGRWPERLEDLVPDYLDRVPADPYDGAPLRLRKLADGLVIYSVGANGQDDGGDVDILLHLDRGGQDIGIRLWDVERRRQAPP
jgi:hypothetical protein